MSAGSTSSIEKMLSRFNHYQVMTTSVARMNGKHKIHLMSTRCNHNRMPYRTSASKIRKEMVDTSGMQKQMPKLEQQNSKLLVEEFRRNATLKWLDRIVIKQKLCPFAPPVRNEPQLRIKVSHASTHEEIVKEVEMEAHLLVGCSKQIPKSKLHQPETTLIILNEERCISLQDFRDLVHLSWSIQELAIDHHAYTSMLQQVLFHPLAKHETYGVTPDEEDSADYTIRSPFPMIHLLREVDLMKAVKSGYKDLNSLPSRNKAKMRKDGLELCRRRLQDCVK